MAAHITLSKSSTEDNGSTYKVTIKMTYYGNGVSWNDAGTSYGTITFNGSTSSKFYHSFTTSSSGQTMGSKTFTVTKKSSSQTLTASGRFVTDVSLGTLTDTLSITIPALASYTVSYNANGGSGAPSSQTKTPGTSLTLSSTVPTRSGYTFMGWATSSTATSATYSAGGTYSTDASVTLYAVWGNAAPTYVYFYNTGGSTLAYSAVNGNTFTFPSPYRSGYTLLGWSTTSGGSISYTGGQQVTWSSSMPTDFYGVWYQSGTTPTYPVILSCSAVRGSGTTVNFTLNFSRGAGSTSVYLYTKLSTSSSYTLQQSWSSVSGTSVSTSKSGFSTDSNYDVQWRLYDSSYGYVYKYDIISSSNYLWKSDGNRLDIGVPLYVQGTQITAHTPLDAWPINSIFISTSSTNPGSVIGGTWQSFGQGRVLIGAGTSDQYFSAGSYGGESYHTLTTSEMPQHRHEPLNGQYFVTNDGSTISEHKVSSGSTTTYKYIYTNSDDDDWTPSGYTDYQGSSSSHNNLQPYIVVYMWKRTA